jgi:RND family efflux transporter MFP subunit
MKYNRLWLATLTVFLAASIAQAQTTEGEPPDQDLEGFTEPIRKLDVIPPEQGVLSSIKVHEGDCVKKDQLLGSLDCDTQEAALRIAQGNAKAHGRLDSAIADRDLRRWRLAKIQTLRKQGNANEEEVTRAAMELAVAEANVLTALEQHGTDSLEAERAAAMLERRMMRSPFDGVVTRVFREEKEFVGGNNTPVMTLMQSSKLRVTFTMPTALAARLKIGQNVALTFPTTGQKATGTIEFISPVTEAESDTVRVKVLIDNKEGKYRCGVRCAISVPRS